MEQRKFREYTIFEKEETIGGLCRSISQNGFTFDYTGHLLHVQDSYFQQLLDTVIGINAFNSIARKSFIYSHEAYTRYPFQVNLFGLPPDIIAECIEQFVNRPTTKKRPRSFYDWVLQNFGQGIAHHFFFPFQTKILAYDLKKVSPTWMGRFVPSTSLTQMIKGALYDNEENLIGYNAQFFYPKHGGIQSWVHAFAKHINNDINRNHTVETIDIKEKKVRFTNGREIAYAHLISTMPLTTLLNCIHDASNTWFKQAAKHLACNAVINFNLGIARANLTAKHWIYFPEKQFPFYRLGFPHNFSSAMAPDGCSSLYGEIAYLPKKSPFNLAVIDDAIAKICKLFSLEKKEIITKKIITIDHAYVIYNAWREKHLNSLLQALEKEGIYSIGRYGGWKYSSMQEAVIDGKKIAELLTILPAYKETVTHSPLIKKKDSLYVASEA